MIPYGERDDDWLRLDASNAAKEGTWGSPYTTLALGEVERPVGKGVAGNSAWVDRKETQHGDADLPRDTHAEFPATP